MGPHHKRKVLLIDDDPLMRHIVMTALAKDDYEISEAGTGAEGVEKAIAERPDLILLDVMMPGMDGFEVCYRLRSNTLTVNIPVIMLTALGNIDEKIHGMQVGADDYVTKPFDPRELRSRLRAHLRRSERDLSASPLTNLPGNPIIEQILRARLTAGEPLAVLYIDLTNFKTFNDKYGWLKGDEAIKMLARAILDTVTAMGSKDDFVGHIGGDDFMVVTTPEHAERVAMEIIARFDTAIPSYYSDQDRACGYIQVLDRQGRTFQAPIMSVAIAIVNNEQKELKHPLQVSDLSAEVKKYVKSLPGSHYAFDRRRE